MKKLLAEFREFAMKGSVVDLAVGVVIGAAFAKIIASLVANIIMPPINLLTSKFGVNFKDWALTVNTEAPKLDDDGKPVLDEAGNAVMAVYDYPWLNIGPFIQTLVDFALVAAGLFAAIKVYNRVKERFEEKPADTPKEVPEDIQLLREIRDAVQKP